MIKSKKDGFTLVELMVVIAIIGILSAIITANFAGAKSKARDAKRVSDLAQMQLALAGYFNACNAFPAADSSTYSPSVLPLLTASCTGSGGNTVYFSTFMPRLPTPPTASESYYYVPYTDVSNGSVIDDYFLETNLENNGASSNNSLTAPPSWYSSASYTVHTACAATGINYCVGPRS